MNMIGPISAGILISAAINMIGPISAGILNSC